MGKVIIWLICFLFTLSNSVFAALDNWDKIELGMTSSQVKKLLGKPTAVNSTLSGGECWKYSYINDCGFGYGVMGTDSYPCSTYGVKGCITIKNNKVVGYTSSEIECFCQ